MFSKFTLLSILLLVSATLAVPASLVEAPPARRSEDHQSPPINRVASRADPSTPGPQWYMSYVAGVSFSTPLSDTWQAVYGILTVPTFHYAEGTSAAVYLRFDGGTDCPWHSLQLGIIYDSNGRYYAFYRWLGHDIVPIPNFAVHPNDLIEANISLDPSNSQDAHLLLHNKQNHNVFNRKFTNNPMCFCKRAVGWFVSPADLRHTLAVFDRVIFSSGLAKDKQNMIYYAACGISSNIQLWPSQLFTGVGINRVDNIIIITDGRWNG